MWPGHSSCPPAVAYSKQSILGGDSLGDSLGIPGALGWGDSCKGRAWDGLHRCMRGACACRRLTGHLRRRERRVSQRFAAAAGCLLWLGIFYLRLVFVAYGEFRFGPFWLRWKIGFVFCAYHSPCPEIGPGLVYLRFPNRKSKRPQL